MVNFSLEGKVAFITGASYGIGFAIARALHEAGATICFNDINQDFVNRGLENYKEANIEAHGYVCDVTNEEEVVAMVKQIKEEVGVIDILVNNAADGDMDGIDTIEQITREKCGIIKNNTVVTSHNQPQSAYNIIKHRRYYYVWTYQKKSGYKHLQPLAGDGGIRKSLFRKTFRQLL